MGLLGIVVAATLLAVIPNESGLIPISKEIEHHLEGRRGFGVLLSIGVLDTATRMG